jgi:Radical SAM superfamily/4Fe-4S single cluster domain
MADALTPASFFEAALNVVIAGFDHEFDAPEVWTALERFPKEDHLVLREHLRHVAPPLDGEGRPHRRARETIAMLGRLIDYHAGIITGAQLLAAADALLIMNSQNPLAAGYHFHCKRLLDPQNPIYQLGDFVCPTPFKQLDVLEQSSHLCCASWLHLSAGNPMEESHDAIWNSDAAAAIRQSVMDGSYRYCNKNACPTLAGGFLTPKAKVAGDPFWQKVFAEKTGKIDRLPKTVNLAYDRHCNLSCPSCRTELITSNDQVRERLDQITQRNIYPLLAAADEAYITGSGDPFASRTFRKLLGWISNETCPNLEVVLMTNGMLFTEEEWAKFPNLRGKVRVVKVSMDGASKESHELLRRRSKWEVMMKNLPFIGTLLQKGDIGAYELIFVVQKENFREMGDFVDLGKAVGASRIVFERITNWGTFTPEQYAEKSVFNRNHPLHDSFLHAMSDPRLQEPQVFVGTLCEYLPEAVRAAG